MKKIFALVLAFVMIFSITACSNTEDTSTTTGTKETTTTTSTTQTSSTIQPTTWETTTAETTAKPTVCENHTYGDEKITEPSYLKAGAKVWECSVCGDLKTEEIPAIDTIKILAIGNSFSVDAMEFLWDICTDAGFKEVILGNLYIGGCTLDTHASNISSNSAAYTYYYNDDGMWQTTNKVALNTALVDEEWDIITIQQGSPDSGRPETFSKLPDILAHIDANKTNDDAKVYWHMTWAYQKGSTQSGFENYGNDQAAMYNAILSTVQNTVLKTEGIDGVIPSGTTVQNLRTSYLGDKLTRDSYHLKYDIGRYAAGLTWFTTLTGVPASSLTSTPSAYYRELSIHTPVLAEAADAAAAKPYEITTCVKTARDMISETRALTAEEAAYLTSLGYDPASYVVPNLELTPFAQYSGSAAANINYSGNTTGLSTLSLFHTTRIFEKDELPNGTLIVAKEGYVYFAHGWVDTTVGGTKTKRTTDPITVVDDAWWGDYQYRSFDFGHTDLKTSMTLEEMDVFFIFVPKA